MLFLAKYEGLLQNGLHRDYRHERDFYDRQTKTARTRIDASCTHIGVHPGMFIWCDSHAQAIAIGLRKLYPGVIA